MAIKEVKRYWESCQLDYVKEFLCHTEKDVEQLPACCVGSKAYVNETGNWYACGKDQVWKLEQEATEEGGGNTGGGGASLAQTYTDMTPGYVNVKTGAFGTGGNWQRTDYIPVSSGDVVTFSGRIGDNMGVAGYDENKAFVASVLDRIDEGSANTYANEPLTIPDGVAYIAGCTNSPSNPITVMVYKDAKALVDAGGTGMPEGGEPYMQLVTDGEGKAQWEQRLAWKEGEKVEITWDGNTEGLIYVGNSNIGFYNKVSDVIVTDDTIKNGVFTATMENGEPMSIGFDQIPIEVVYTDEVTFIENLAAFVRNDGATVGELVFPEKGVYFYTDYMHSMWISSFVSNFEFIKLIDPDLINLILPETHLTATATGSGSGRQYSATFTPLAEIKEGDYVRVIADGINYNTQVATASIGLGLLDAHSGQELSFEFSDGRSAFIVKGEDGWKVFNVGNSWNSCTLAMYRMTPADLPGPIPAEYLSADVLAVPVAEEDNGKLLGVVDGAVGLVDAPSGGGVEWFVVRCTTNQYNQYVADATVEEVRNASNAGKKPILSIEGSALYYMFANASQDAALFIRMNMSTEDKSFFKIEWMQMSATSNIATSGSDVVNF